MWITGLPGSGKTTLAKEVFALLRKQSPAVIRLDGDMIREMLGGDLSYSMEDRLKNALRIGRLCKLLVDQGQHVVCATVSLFRELHDWNRANFPSYVEIYLRVTEQTLHARDQKGLFSGGGQHVVGLSQPFDVPANPTLIIDNDDAPPAQSAARIAALVKL